MYNIMHLRPFFAHGLKSVGVLVGALAGPDDLAKRRDGVIHPGEKCWNGGLLVWSGLNGIAWPL